MKKIAVLLIIAGAAILFYPKAEAIYYAQQEQKIINEYRELDDLFTNYDDPQCIEQNCDIAVLEKEIEAEKLNVWNRPDIGSPSGEGVFREISQSVPETLHEEETRNEAGNEREDKTPGDIAGLIMIDKINLTLPVLYGASSDQLSKGAGYLTESGQIGEAGNAAVAAHRSHTYGRQFNRLGEIEPGDEVKVKVPGKGIFTYEVFDIKIVKPENTGVLNPFGDKSVLTLITCDPMTNPTHRLIVHAEKKS